MRTSPAAALTAICSPEGIDSGKIVKEFRESFDAVVANGQGEMKGQLFRIAHIGYYDYLDTIGILGALEHVLARMTGKGRRVRLRRCERRRKFMRAVYRAERNWWELEDRAKRSSRLVDRKVHRGRGFSQSATTAVNARSCDCGIGHRNRHGCQRSRCRRRDGRRELGRADMVGGLSDAVPVDRRRPRKVAAVDGQKERRIA